MTTRSLYLIAEGLLFAFTSQMSAAALGCGVLGAAVNYPVGASPQSIVTGDFNGDGHLDLATANPVAQIQDGSGTLSVLLGDGVGVFGAAINSSLGIYGFNRVSLTAADFDSDGNDDLAFVPQSTSGGPLGAAGVGVLLSNGNGTFGSTVWAHAVNYTEAVASGDFNNDGNSDLVASGYDDVVYRGYARVLLGNGQGGFAYSPYATSFDGNSTELAVGDFNGDGKLDAVGVAGEYDGYGVALLGNGGAGAFASYYEFFSTSERSGDVAVGDFTGDGIPDIVTAGWALDVLIGRGDGTFDEPTAYPTNANSHTGVAVADFNGDGLLDAVTSDPYTETVSEMLGNGNGALTYAAAYAVGSLPSGVAVGDFNGDGRTDVSTANSGSNDVSVLLNQMTLAPPGDFNGDNIVDAADYVVWRKNNIGGESGYNDWRTNFGALSPGAAAGAHSTTSAIPEPASLGLLLPLLPAALLLPARRGPRPLAFYLSHTHSKGAIR